MSDIARLYIYIITGLIIGCMSIGLCYAVYYIVNDKELLLKLINETKIIVLGIGCGWLIPNLISKFKKK